MIFSNVSEKRIYDLYGISDMPKYFGYPNQIFVKDFDELTKLMTIHKNIDPLYISHNTHNKEYVLYSQMFFDFDAHSRIEDDMEKARLDCSKFVEYHKEKTDLLINFTGGGFHVLLKFKPVTVRMNEISPKIKGYEKHIMETLNLKTMDLKVAEPGRLFRIPLSPYVYHNNGTNVTTDRYDIPITSDMLKEYNIDDLIYFSKKKEYSVNPFIGKRFSIDYIKLFETKETYRETEILDEDIDFYSFPEDYFRKQIGEIMNNDVLLINSLMSKHPNHNTRFIACLKMRDIGFSLNSTCSFFARLSELSEWDNRNISVQKYQIQTIYDNKYKMRSGRG